MSILLLESEDVAWFRDEPESARGAAAALARRIGLSERRGAEVALAVAEAATNLRKHAVDGAILLRVVRTERHAGVEFVAVDSGPGMTDVAGAVRDGNSSAGTLGIGLGAVARLADAFDIHSIPGQGTVLAARFWPTGSSGFPGTGTGALTAGREPAVAGVTRAISGERVCGDAWAARIDDVRSSAHSTPASPAAGPGPLATDWPALTATRRTTAAPTSHPPGHGPAVMLMLSDGLGHGPMAALAGEAATRTFLGSRARLPEDAMQEIHRALRGTRGAAVAVARIEPDGRRLLFCGVGNIAAALVNGDGRATLVSHPGIVGHQMRGLRTFEHQLPPGGALVMHSDGLTERWSVSALPGLLLHPPVVMAAQLLRHAGVRRDDAGVVVAKGLW